MVTSRIFAATTAKSIPCGSQRRKYPGDAQGQWWARPVYPRELGAPMNGQQYEDQWGNVLNFTPQPNTFQTFFRKEKQLVNNLSLEGGNDNINYRLSYGNTNIDGYTPGNTLKRNNVNLRTVAKITSKLELDVKANYIGQREPTGQRFPTRATTQHTCLSASPEASR